MRKRHDAILEIRATRGGHKRWWQFWRTNNKVHAHPRPTRHGALKRYEEVNNDDYEKVFFDFMVGLLKSDRKKWIKDSIDSDWDLQYKTTDFGIFIDRWNRYRGDNRFKQWWYRGQVEYRVLLQIFDKKWLQTVAKQSAYPHGDDTVNLGYETKKDPELLEILDPLYDDLFKEVSETEDVEESARENQFITKVVGPAAIARYKVENRDET